MKNGSTVHFWSDAATLPADGTQAPYGVCTISPTPRTKFTTDKNAVTCKHCLRLLAAALRDPARIAAALTVPAEVAAAAATADGRVSIITTAAERRQIARVMNFDARVSFAIDWNKIAQTARELNANFEVRANDDASMTVTMFWAYAADEAL
jgi:hypothetical protein